MYRRCKATWFEHGGKGARSWVQPHPVYVWIPMAEAKLYANVRVHLRDHGEQEVRIEQLDDLCVPGKFLPHCQYIPPVTL